MKLFTSVQQNQRTKSSMIINNCTEFHSHQLKKEISV